MKFIMFSSLILAGNLAAQIAPPKPLPPPAVTWTSEQDHRNMMDQLGIKALRPGPSGNDADPNHANYDETKANPYPNLPDAMTLKNGKRITTADQWWKQRRPEIEHDMQEYVYGFVPKNVPDVTWQVQATEQQLVGQIPVISKHVVGHVDNSSYPLIDVDIDMTLVTPANASKPVPVLMMFGRQPIAATSEQLIADGWGYATLNPASIQADNGAGITRGIIGLVNEGQPRHPDDWGALRAWAWGAGRALDYLQTDAAVDAKHVGIEGVSRYGKAALVTEAFDQRFYMGLIGSSGEGGAKLNRRNWGEAVESLTGGEYYWMAGNFMKYGASDATFGSKNAGDIPVDSHELIALCAPRLTFISYGVPEKGDAKWLDHQGSYMATVAAQPVFQLVGAKTLGVSSDYHTEKMPAVDVGLLDGQLAWRQHDGGHTDAPNIKYFIAWADRFMGRNSADALQIAFTWDDLPVHGPLPPGETRVDIGRKLIAAMKADGMPPAYGFVNAIHTVSEPAATPMLQEWRDAGLPLGSHTWSHMNLNQKSVEDWEADVLQNEAPLKSYMLDADWHWLRYPYLAEGETSEKRLAARRFLAEHGYHIAGVTMSFGDYLYNDAYVRCVARKDADGAAKVKDSYLAAASATIAYTRAMSKTLYGRDIPYVLLMHVGALDAEMLPDLLKLYRDANFTFVSLQEAEKDSFYKSDLDLSLNPEPDSLEEAMRLRHLPLPKHAGPDMDLDAVCK